MDQQRRECIVCSRWTDFGDLNYMSALRINLEGQICDECADILDLTLKAVSRARRDGNHYTRGSWRTDNERDNLEHALTHIFKHKRQDTTEDHIAHAICDLVIEYARTNK